MKEVRGDGTLSMSMCAAESQCSEGDTKQIFAFEGAV